MSRIYMNGFDDWGCGYYRAKLPVYHCYSDLNKQKISLHLEKELHSDEMFYSAYILHRIPMDNSIFFMQNIQKLGGKFVLELDDDILNIPEWMPSDEFKNSKWSFKRGLEMADEVWVSTEALAKSLNLPNKTYVLPNLTDYNSWLIPNKPKTDPIRILWMGSMWHDKDLEQLVNPVLRIIEEYGNKVQFLFWGCLPTAFADFQRLPGQNLAILTQKKDYGERIIFLEGIPFKLYFDRVVNIAPYIGLAPLYDCQFNDGKCVVGDTLVVTPSGILDIKEINEKKEKSVCIPENNQDKDIVGYYHYVNKKTLRIKTSFGYTIEGTPHHKVLNSDKEWIKLGDLSLGDKIVITPFEIKQQKYQYIPYPLLLTKCLNGDTFNESDLEMLPRIVINEKWGRLIGYLLGDGHIASNGLGVSCSTDYPDVIEDVESLFLDVGLRPVRRVKTNSHKKGNPPTKMGKGIDVLAPSHHLCGILKHIGFTGRYGKIFKIPNIVLQSPKSVIREFIRGLFESDGTVENTGLSFTTKSEKLANHVQFVLLGFGIKSRIRSQWNNKYECFYYTVALGRQAAEIFNKDIGFISKSKNDDLNVVCSKNHSNNYKLWEWSDDVESIEKTHNDVYDIEVEDYHYYIGNGFVSHNSSIKYLEYTMANAATIATNTVPYQCIENGVDGLLVEPEDEEGWYRAIKTLIDNQDYRNQLVSAASNKVYTEHSWQSQSKKQIWLDSFERLVGK